jgi:predicted secreted protein
MNAVAVVDILKLGISGLVFLLALMGYRLVAKHQEAKKQSPALTRFFIRMTLASAIIAGTFGLIERWVRENRRDIRFGQMADAFTECHRSLVRLETSSKLQGTTKPDLQSAISNHVAVCSSILEKLDE